jgi:hypothetical protein
MSNRYVKSEVKSGASEDLLVINPSKSARAFRFDAIDDLYMATTPPFLYSKLLIVGSDSKTIKVHKIIPSVSGLLTDTNGEEILDVTISRLVFTNLPASPIYVTAVPADSASPSSSATVLRINGVTGITSTDIFYRNNGFGFITSTNFSGAKFFSDGSPEIAFDRPIVINGKYQCLEVSLYTNYVYGAISAYWTER